MELKETLPTSNYEPASKLMECQRVNICAFCPKKKYPNKKRKTLKKNSLSVSRIWIPLLFETSIRFYDRITLSGKWLSDDLQDIPFQYATTTTDLDKSPLWKHITIPGTLFPKETKNLDRFRQHCRQFIFTYGKFDVLLIQINIV